MGKKSRKVVPQKATSSKKSTHAHNAVKPKVNRKVVTIEDPVFPENSLSSSRIRRD